MKTSQFFGLSPPHVRGTSCMDGSTVTRYNSSSAAAILSSAENMWWHIKRVYECESANEYDFTDAMKRSKHVTGSVQDNTTVMSSLQ